MALFRYQALTPEGKKINGLIEADSLGSAKDRLKARKVLVVGLAQEKYKNKKGTLTHEVRFSLTRELGQLLKAGLPLYESLSTIEEKSRKEKYHFLLIDLIDRLKQGETLSKALKNYPKAFDGIYLSMITSAEESGTLPEAFFELSRYLEKQAKWKKQLITITAYPLFLLSFAMFIFSSLLFFVIPSMQELFEGRSLHPLTQSVLFLSQFARDNVLWIILCPILIGGTLFFALREPSIRRKISETLLRIPFVGDVILQSAMSRFARAVGLLLANGIPLLETLRLTGPTLKHPLFEEALTRAEKRILEGHALHRELKESKIFPLTVVRLIAIAEETGRMRETFFSIAEIYEEELDKSLSRLTTVLQPALLLLLGVIVGVMILAVLLPLTDVSSMLS